MKQVKPVLTIIGAVSIVIGVGLLSWPVALIVAGALCVGIGES